MTYPLIGEISTEEMEHLLTLQVNPNIRRTMGVPFFEEVAELFDRFVTYKNNNEVIPNFGAHEVPDEQIAIVERYAIASSRWYVLTAGEGGILWSDAINDGFLQQYASSTSERDRNISVSIVAGATLQYLMRRRGYIGHGNHYYAIGLRSHQPIYEMHNYGLHLSTSMRSALENMQDEGENNKVINLFRSVSTIGAKPSGYPDYRSNARIDRMNYLTVRDTGNISYLPIKGDGEVESPWARAGRQETRPGRFIRSFFTPEEIAREGVGDKEIEKFATAFSADAKPPEGIEIISGAEIKRAYYENNYSDTENLGDMGSSCMRYRQCQSYFGIYTDNPNQVSMCVIKDSHGKYVARTIIWTDVDGNRWHDRIYATAVLMRQMATWLNDQGIMDIRSTSQRVVVRPDKPWHSRYPYMDTMRYIMEDGTLSTMYGSGQSYEQLTQTGGGPAISTRVCARCGAVRFRSQYENNMCSDCVNLLRSALVANLRQENHQVRQVHVNDMRWLQYNHANMVLTNRVAGVSLTIINGATYKLDGDNWKRMTKKAVLALEADQRRMDRARAKLMATCVTDRDVIMQHLGQNVFPGSFDVTAHLREGVHWGWVDAPSDLIYLRADADAEKRMVVQVMHQAEIPWGYGLRMVRTEKLVNGQWTEVKRARRALATV